MSLALSGPLMIVTVASSAVSAMSPLRQFAALA
jgi:hypothetical protein